MFNGTINRAMLCVAVVPIQQQQALCSMITTASQQLIRWPNVLANGGKQAGNLK